MKGKPFRVLVPLDASEGSHAIVHAIVPLMARRSVELTLHQAAHSRKELPETRLALEAVRETFSRQGLRVSVRAGWGAPAGEILAFSRTGRFDCVAMTTHGRRGLNRALRGSVAETVLRSASTPVLLCRPDVRPKPWSPILVALDGSSAAEKILPEAVALAKRVKARLFVMRVGHSRPSGSPGRLPSPRQRAEFYVFQVASRLSSEGVPALPAYRRGVAAGQILKYAAQIDAGLICMTTHGRTGMERVLFGSVAERVVRSASCPVLVVRSAEAGAVRKQAT